MVMVVIMAMISFAVRAIGVVVGGVRMRAGGCFGCSVVGVTMGVTV